eukprot:scaffold8749_cov36-Attheya_sp.AAC.1
MAIQACAWAIALRCSSAPVRGDRHGGPNPAWRVASKGFPVATLLATPRLMPVGVEADAAGTTEAFAGNSTAQARQFRVSLSSSSLDAASIVKPSASRGSRALALTAWTSRRLSARRWL